MTGRQARDLNGIGEVLEKQIDRWLANPAELYDFPTNRAALRKQQAQGLHRSPKRKKAAHPAPPLAPKLLPLVVGDEDVAQRKPLRNTNGYTPRSRSGAWALLMGLYAAERKGKDPLSKEEVVEQARKLFVASEADSKEEAPAWSAMATLVSKGLVQRTASSGTKYSLTAEGRGTARRLAPLDMPLSPAKRSVPRSPMPIEPPGDDGTSDAEGNPSSRQEKAMRRDTSPVKSVPDSDYWFVSADGSAVASKSQAEITLEDDALWVQIECKNGKQIPQGARTERRGSKTIHWLLDALAPSAIKLVTVPASSPGPAIVSKSPRTSPRRPSPTPLPRPVAGNVSPRSGNKSPRKRLRRDGCQIVALLDNREVKDRKDRTHIAEQLTKGGVACEVRALELGDVVWAVRRPGKPDLVLDWILERKRVSDLESSIMDGRFKEQKFRLQRSGATNFVYLVEGLLEKVRSLDPAAIQTALAQTQLEDRFIVIHTTSLSASIARIASLTEAIERGYAATDWDKEERHGRRTLERFMSDASKSKNLSIRDLFALQLLCISGVSPPKAAAITSKYATPAELYSAYQEATAPDKLLENLKWQSGKRLGPALSKKVYEHFKL